MTDLNFQDLPDISFFRKSFSGETTDSKADTETRLLVAEAQRLGFLWRVVPNSDVIELSYKGHLEYLRRRTPSSNRSPGTRICSDKNLTRSFLEEANLPTNKGYAIRNSDSEDYRASLFKSLQKPVVVKPAHGTHGACVKIGVENLENYLHDVKELFETIEQDKELERGSVAVEEMFQGTEYRIIATRERVVAIMYRKPASIVGDGQHTVTQLIKKKNTDPMRNLSQDMYPHITIDKDMMAILSDQGYDEESVPDEGHQVWLRRVSNIMAGGDAYDATDEAHESVKEIAMKTIQAIPGLTFGGIDFMTKDIKVDQNDDGCAIIEVNSAPEFAMHDFPMHGKKRGVAIEVLSLMFPELRSL